MEHGGPLSRKATCNSHGQDSSYFIGWQEYERNPYHPVANPQGIIQMGLAENQLSFDLIESWLARHPEAAGFKNQDGISVFRELALFQDYCGLPAFKHALSKLMGRIRGDRVRFDPDKLILTAGSTSANETLIFCLAEPGDAFLLPTPYYPGFDRDLKWRTGVEIVPIKTWSTNGFRVTKAALEEAFEQAEGGGMRVRGVLITNPSNPLGTTSSEQELETLIRFVAAKRIHLISDEIYSGTVFASPPFVSAKEVAAAVGVDGLLMPGHGDVAHRVHIVCSLSKDLGLPGFRVGAIYSDNDAVVSAATKMSSFGLVSSHTQHLLSAMLLDNDDDDDRGGDRFARRYLAENKKRIMERHRVLLSGLRRAGIGCLEGNAGLFCWVDMRHLLSSADFDAEMELWRKMLYEVGINISPGSSCHCGEPGWFRLCFANMAEETLDVAMGRIRCFVDGGSTGCRRRCRTCVAAPTTGQPDGQRAAISDGI